MDIESKGIAWFGNIYRKLETVLVEVDDFASQSCIALSGQGSVSPKRSHDAQGLIFVRDEQKEVMERCSSGTSDMQQYHDDLALPSCKDHADPPSDENLEEPGSIHSDEQVDGNGSNEKLSDEEMRFRAPLHEEYIGNNNQTAATSLCPTGSMSLQETNRRDSDDSQSNIAAESQSSSGSFRTEVPCNDYSTVCSSGHSSTDSNLVQVVTDIPALLVGEDMAKMRTTGSNSITSIGNQDDFCNDEHDAAPLQTMEFFHMANREGRSDIDDCMLYAVCHRTRKLRSFKKKVLDALASKRQREKEYEQLAIWFGDASMGSEDTEGVLVSPKAATPIDSKSSQGSLASEDSEWELL